MNDQQEVSAALRLWQEWTKANLDSWNQMFQGRNVPSWADNTFFMFQKWNSLTQEQWSRALQNMVETPAFAQLLGTSMEAFLTSYNTFVKPVQAYLSQNLQVMNVASSEDLTRIAEMVVRLENKVDQLADEIDAAVIALENSGHAASVHKDAEKGNVQ